MKFVHHRIFIEGICIFIVQISLFAARVDAHVVMRPYVTHYSSSAMRGIDTVSPPVYTDDFRYGMDSTVNPCDDFYQYVNGGWRNVAILPAMKESKNSKVKGEQFRYVGGLQTAVPNVYKWLTAIIDSVALARRTITSPTLRTVVTFYQSCLHTDSLDVDPFMRLRNVTQATDSTKQDQCLQRVFQHVGDAAAQLLVEKLKQSSASDRMDVIVSSIVKEAANRIRSNTVLSDVQKETATAELARLKLRVGIPENIIDYSALQLMATDYHKNVQTVKDYSHQRWVKTIGATPKDAWVHGLIRANATYIPNQHAIEIPPVWFFPPFFYEDGDQTLNFAAVGWVIAHEIYHSIAKSVGMKIDDTSVSMNAFLQFTSSLGTLDGWSTDGRRTWSEDVADLGGARATYAAWNTRAEKHSDSAIKRHDGFTPDQRFFIAMGQLWRAKWQGGKDADVHAAPFARVNGTVMQMPEFAKAFGCKPGDRMYLAPEHLSPLW